MRCTRCSSTTARECKYLGGGPAHWLSSGCLCVPSTRPATCGHAGPSPNLHAPPATTHRLSHADPNPAPDRSLAVVIARVIAAMGWGRIEPLTWQVARLWMPVNVIFVAMLATNFYALKTVVSVDYVIGMGSTDQRAAGSLLVVGGGQWCAAGSGVKRAVVGSGAQAVGTRRGANPTQPPTQNAAHTAHTRGSGWSRS